MLYIVHEQRDEAIDTFAQLGNTKEGLASADGMVVFGFGRGRNGIEPLLRGKHSFRIGLLEQTGRDKMAYRDIHHRLSSNP